MANSMDVRASLSPVILSNQCAHEQRARWQGRRLCGAQHHGLTFIKANLAAVTAECPTCHQRAPDLAPFSEGNQTACWGRLINRSTSIMEEAVLCSL